MFKFTFDHTPFKGEIDNLVFFTTVSHVQTKYANTEVQDSPTVAAIMPFMNKPDSAYDDVKVSAAGDKTIKELKNGTDQEKAAAETALKSAKTKNDEARDSAFRDALRRNSG